MTTADESAVEDMLEQMAKVDQQPQTALRIGPLFEAGFAAGVKAERERCAKIAETMPDRVLVMYDRPHSPPGNTYVHISGQKLIAQAIRRNEK